MVHLMALLRHLRLFPHLYFVVVVAVVVGRLDVYLTRLDARYRRRRLRGRVLVTTRRCRLSLSSSCACYRTDDARYGEKEFYFRRRCRRRTTRRL